MADLGRSRCRDGRRRAARCESRSALLVTEDELLRLARAFEQLRGRQPTMDELRQIDAWATRTRANAALLPLVLQGLLLLDLDAEGEPVFRPLED